MQVARHHGPKQTQLSVKKVGGSRHYSDRKVLRTCPVEHRRQRNRVVQLAMNEQCLRMQASRHRRHGKAAGCHTYQNKLRNRPLRVQTLERAAGDERAK